MKTSFFSIQFTDLLLVPSIAIADQHSDQLLPVVTILLQLFFYLSTQKMYSYINIILKFYTKIRKISQRWRKANNLLLVFLLTFLLKKKRK